MKAGWGDWAGPGVGLGSEMITKKKRQNRDKLIVKLNREHEIRAMERSDRGNASIIISEERLKAAAKYKVEAVPYPYQSREEYERAMQMPLGSEWNATQVVTSRVQPEIKTRSGRIIQPITLIKKQSSSQKLSQPISSSNNHNSPNNKNHSHKRKFDSQSNNNNNNNHQIKKKR